MANQIDARPLDPVTVKKFYWTSDGKLVYKPGEQFQVADLDTVQRAVNFAALQALQRYSLIALGLMFILSLLIGWWVAGRALRPVGAVTRTAQEISTSDLTRRIDAGGPPDELRTLADTIDSMLDRLERGFTSERTLVQDVSHELRNPVAVVQANVEAVLARDDSTSEERAQASAVVLDATRRMSRLLEDLLATARTRFEAFSDRPLDLSQLVRSASQEYDVLARQRGITLAERIRTDPQVFADPDVLGRALSNLLSNAVRVAPDESTVLVGVGSTRGWAWVAIADQGPGIPEDSRGRVFDRFYQAPGPRSGGSGLGLAIARQIVESHEGRLRLARSGDDGSTFVIWLPDRSLADAPDRLPEPPDEDPLGTI